MLAGEAVLPLLQEVKKDLQLLNWWDIWDNVKAFRIVGVVCTKHWSAGLCTHRSLLQPEVQAKALGFHQYQR